jgi:hypothetical protein
MAQCPVPTKPGGDFAPIVIGCIYGPKQNVRLPLQASERPPEPFRFAWLKGAAGLEEQWGAEQEAHLTQKGSPDEAPYSSLQLCRLIDDEWPYGGTIVQAFLAETDAAPSLAEPAGAIPIPIDLLGMAVLTWIRA